MVKFKVKFQTLDKVAQFVNICSKYEEDINFKAANYHYIVDAKSIIAMISIGLNEICEVHLNTNSEDLADTFKENIERWIIT